MMKAISLISLGIDSPVSTKMIMDKNIEVIGLHFFFVREKEILRKIFKKIGLNKCYTSEIVSIHNKIPYGNKNRCLMCKRFMYRMAEKIAEKENADFIVTGENLAQVASQTLGNLFVLDQSVSVNVVRPLLCYEKNEIISKAKEIGTYELSIIKNKRCSYVPKNPATNANLKRVIEEEKKFGLFEEEIQQEILK